MQSEPIFKTTNEINSVAGSFLASYHSDFSIPIPIEEILDNNLKIDIVPFPDLKNSFSKAGFDIDAFIANDFKSISIDKYIYCKQPNRFRFSLAHEIGHMYLHAYMYKQFYFKNRDEWKQLIKNIPAPNRDKFEWQANEFAGLLLVPRKILRQEFEKARNKAEKVKLKYDVNADSIKDILIKHILPKKFQVSAHVVEIRAGRDKLI